MISQVAVNAYRKALAATIVERRDAINHGPRDADRVAELNRVLEILE